ncbi:hypothetical protein T02_3783 [Trichinella nativa]|uniref:Uncharacterized protein n=1 Tax=Trichinella nativa TaxID=6335 RepID=A0A0V1LQS2_9BILA|nr:hypothetical protein T02_3783 [Trichinella nativa]
MPFDRGAAGGLSDPDSEPPDAQIAIWPVARGYCSCPPATSGYHPLTGSHRLGRCCSGRNKCDVTRNANNESARPKGRGIRRSIPARRQIAMDAPITWWKKRTSLLEAAARYNGGLSGKLS